ncbi:MAG: hypothetical protein NC099_03995 [Corallococcus sp.]|nr:hypothetical protein [Bacillota bacterium]MCM1533797.1 hypothetical protein [Corallococcus sp.]
MVIAVFGAKGRVGKKVCEIAKARGHAVCEIDKEDDVFEVKCDAAIDFSAAEATRKVCDFCTVNNCPLISGVTGRTDEQQKTIDELKKKVTVIEKPNFSQGIALLQKICAFASNELKNWDCEITETHRKGKIDAPSGTAKELAAVISKNKGSFTSVTIHSRRLGSAHGTHCVTFATNGESVTFTHTAENTDIFALGAVKAAENPAENF